MKSNTMFKLSTFIAILLCTMTYAGTTQPASFVDKLKAGTPQKIVFYGTSLTHYGAWPKQVTEALDHAFPKLVTTFNGAQSGEQSRWGLQHVKERVIDQQPDVVFIEFTTNDAVRRFNLSVDQARKNTQSIIDQILAARPDCQIILLTMNPVIGRPKGDGGERVDLPAYEQMYRDLCKAHGYTLIDNAPGWKTLLDQGEDEYKKFVPDGTHPNGPGFEKYVTPNVIKTLGMPQSSK